MSKKFTAFLAALTLTLCASSIQAEQVTVDFTGSVNNPVNGDPFGTGIIPAESVTGTFVYETTATDLDGSPSIGLYPQSITDGFSVLVDGTHLFTSSDYVVEVNSVADEFHIRVNSLNLNGNPIAFYAPGQSFSLDSLVNDPFPDDSLPSLFPSIATFEGFAQGRFTDPSFDSFVFSIDSLTQVFVVVPEPLSLLLGLQASVAVGLVWLRRKRSQTA